MNTATYGQRLAHALKIRNKSRRELAEHLDISVQAVGDVINGKSNSFATANHVRAAAFLEVGSEWLEGGTGGMDWFDVFEGFDGDEGTQSIDLYMARGSCGGGHLNGDDASQTSIKLVKEASWFVKYGVTPDGILAIYADGDSMADFIVDGDIVFFNTKMTRLHGGKIYAIDTPDGLRIKRVTIRADGSVTLGSDNHNKARYPDETYSIEEAQSITVRGEFFYRQGG